VNSSTLAVPSRAEVKSAAAIPAYSVHLDAVRGCAALVVFLTHLRYIFLGSSAVRSTVSGVAQTGQRLQQQIMATTDLGHKAVMAFFVLSGYFVGGSVLRTVRQGRWSWGRYLLNRLTRLWMVLLPALLLCFVLDHLGSRLFPNSIYSGPPGQDILLPGLLDRLGKITFLGNVLFLQTIVAQEFGSDVSLWSLANEFWYYIAFPLLALFFARGKSTVLRVACLVSLTCLLFFIGGKISSHFLIWLFGVGAGLVPLGLPKRVQIPSIVATLLALGAACVSLKFYGDTNRFQVDVIIGLLFSLLLYCLVHRTENAKPGPYRTTAQFVAKMSYTLYLLNLPLLFFVNAILVRHWHHWPANPVHLLAIAGVAASIFSFAYVFHLCFEAHTDQVRRWLSERMSNLSLTTGVVSGRGQAEIPPQ
jgi:peptidoglycan/LPS O-acetylase OafA/YrhL